MKFDFASLIYHPRTVEDFRFKNVSSERQPKQVAPEPLTGLAGVRFDRASFLELWRERSAMICVETGMPIEDADYKAFQDVWSQASEQIAAPTGLDLLPTETGCCHCGYRFVIERSDGLECWGCQRMAWKSIGSSIVRADFADLKL